MIKRVSSILKLLYKLWESRIINKLDMNEERFEKQLKDLKELIWIYAGFNQKKILLSL